MSREGRFDRDSRRDGREGRERRGGGGRGVPYRSKDAVPRATLYVTGFVKGTSARRLAELFETYGPLAQVNVMPPRQSDGEQYAFVAFRKINDMNAILDDLERGKIFDDGLALDPDRGIACERARRLPVSQRHIERRRYDPGMREPGRYRDDRRVGGAERRYDDRRYDDMRERDWDYRRDDRWEERAGGDRRGRRYDGDGDMDVDHGDDEYYRDRESSARGRERERSFSPVRRSGRRDDARDVDQDHGGDYEQTQDRPSSGDNRDLGRDSADAGVANSSNGNHEDNNNSNNDNARGHTDADVDADAGGPPPPPPMRDD